MDSLQWTACFANTCTLSLFSLSMYMNKPVKPTVKSYLKISARNLRLTVTSCIQSPVTSPDSIVETLHEAAKTTIPTKIVQLKGPKWKLSPEAAAISKQAKALHKTSLDPPLGTNLADLKAQQKETKHQL